MVCPGQGCTEPDLLLPSILISSACVVDKSSMNLTSALGYIFLALSTNVILDKSEPGTFCECLHRLVELFLIVLGEIELRVAVISLIALVDEEAV